MKLKLLLLHSLVDYVIHGLIIHKWLKFNVYYTNNHEVVINGMIITVIITTTQATKRKKVTKIFIWNNKNFNFTIIADTDFGDSRVVLCKKVINIANGICQLEVVAKM